MHLRWTAPLVALGLLLHVATTRGADEEPETPKADKAAKARLEMMRKSIGDFHMRSSHIESPDALKFSEEPILRFNDQSRLEENGAQALLDATAWRLGETGVPSGCSQP